MKELRRVKITQTGRFIPPGKVTNSDLEKRMDTSDEWIRKRSGIETRYHVDANTSTSDLAFEASKNALDKANLKAADIDFIITATLSPDHHFPGIGVKLQDRLGLNTTPAMDIRNQCSGFIYALNTAVSFIATGQYERILVTGAEVHSKLINLTTTGRDIAVLFGDGAGSIILEAAESQENGFIGFQLHSEGKYFNKLWLDRPGTARGPHFIEPEDIELGRHFPFMEGRTVFKHATQRLQETLTHLLKTEGVSVESIDHFLFHQANLRINEYVAQQFGIPNEKVHNNIQKYGNCSAASLPILLDETIETGKINRGDLVCLAAFGAGFTWASCLFEF